MAAPYNPFYATSSSDQLGYNERAGSTAQITRNPYLYSGSARMPQQELAFTSPRVNPHGPLQTMPPVHPSATGLIQRLQQEEFERKDRLSNLSTHLEQEHAAADARREAFLTARVAHAHELGSSHRDWAMQSGYAASGYRTNRELPSAKSKMAHVTDVYGYGNVARGLDQAQITVEEDPNRRPRTPPLVRPGLTHEKELSARNVGKLSVSRRLPERERLRYHVPGYMGYVPNQKFIHGETYGRTTRRCVVEDV